ncbi:Putative bacteriophage protein [Candidatus Glomeribacter gigasporarum BEG34]|uniref:Putative bacteriophage protein n=1 Tax=Candidatus Glomeribacter gigasporarum BEG34 TaxID=1070319 RepID=G2JBR6_9BURK|nr:DUF2612 domain-containing protein [Candidatus Glomeribacter gigasporarum]CCD30221.1 Putative bacteriophage protein [Candidatus Glomeribacter gigasporarum BEG34]
MASLQDDLARIPAANRDKPKFRAVIEASVQPFVDLHNALASMPAAFDVDQAIGAQLDQVGTWVGLARAVQIPLTGIYFTLDDAHLGFDQGVWKQPHDPTEGVTRLDDDTYRLLLKAKIRANHWDGAPDSMADMLNAIFGADTHVFVQDNGDMSITVGIAGQIPHAAFLAILTRGYLALKPEGVRVAYVIVTPENGAPLFGFDVHNACISGFDTGAWGRII